MPRALDGAMALDEDLERMCWGPDALMAELDRIAAELRWLDPLAGMVGPGRGGIGGEGVRVGVHGSA